MLRVASCIVLLAGFLVGAAFQSGNPKFLERPFPVNSTIACFFLENDPADPPTAEIPDAAAVADSASGMHILMLNCTAYDSAYVHKVKKLITKRLPGAILTDFWSGSPQDLSEMLLDQHIVMVTYPASGNNEKVRAFGKVLNDFVKQGGAVVFSGTDQFGVLQMYGLFDISFGYFCSDLEVHELNPEHPVLAGAPGQFFMRNYTYPLDISDPNFISLADVRGYPVMGYKNIGAGKAVYLGLEYYYDEAVSSQILENTLRWLGPAVKNSVPASTGTVGIDSWPYRTAKRNEEVLYAGSGPAGAKTISFDLKIYPNPFMEKGTVDLNLIKQTPVSVEMTDEKGTVVAVLLPYRQLNAGAYRLDLPSVSPGVYFVKCQAGNQTTVRKVVKIAAQ